MSGNPRPRSVTILAWVYIAVGAVSFVFGFPIDHAPQSDDILAELVRLLAILAGAYMLRGKDWARWLALAWIAFHVALSAAHLLGEFVMHSLFFIVIAWYLLRPGATRYFRP